MDTPALSRLPELALPLVEKLQTTAQWGATPALPCTMPVDLYVTPLIL